ncbi:MAG: protein phosphatase 2C domain-containing protein [Kiritimatiellae bacterium]|nr:protein phosphatase 2C domain-containing protein [Kiritimatiellia bacterium]
MNVTQQQSVFATPLDVAGISDRGCIRADNQDAWMADELLRLVVVADGMGGRPAGAEAAQMVTECLPEFLRKGVTGVVPKRRSARRLLRETVLAVSREILRVSADDPKRKGMGTTMVAAWQCGEVLHLAHQGDSRAYLLRGGSLRKLTADHSIVVLLVRNGEITEEEAEKHPARGQLTRFVGMPGDVYCGLQTLGIKDGDRLLLCTDGLWGVVKNDEIAATLLEQARPEDACRKLVSLAVEYGAPDNVTAVVWNLGL